MTRTPEPVIPPATVRQPSTGQKTTNTNKLHKSFSSESLLATLKYATAKTPANLPMVSVTDYHSTHPEEVSVNSGCIVSALYKTGKYLFVRTSDNNTGFLPVSVVRPLYSKSELITSSDKTYQNLPHTKTRMTVHAGSQKRCNSHGEYCDNLCCNNVCSCIKHRLPESRSHNTSGKGYSRRFGSFDSSFDSCYSSSSATSSSSLSDNIVRCNSTCQTALCRNECVHNKYTCASSIRNPIPTASENHPSRTYPKQPSFKAKKGARLTVIFDFQRRFGGDISVNSHEVVTYLADDGADWLWIRRSDGQEGFIPRNCVANLEALNLDPYSRTTYL